MVKQGRQTGLSPEEERFVEQLREQYVPGPMTPARRAAFDESLRARTGRRERRTPTWAPMAAGKPYPMVPSPPEDRNFLGFDIL